MKGESSNPVLTENRELRTGFRAPSADTLEPQEAEEHLVSFEPIRNGKCDCGLRRHPYQSGVSGKNPELVAWRSYQARDHQLPYLQAGARRVVLRAHLWPGDGLGVLVR